MAARRPWPRRAVFSLALMTLLLPILVAAPAFGADAATVKLPNGEGPHCAGNGWATRVFLSVRTKEAVDPGSIRAVSDVWTQTSVAGARNSWLLRLRGPRPVAASVVQVVTSGGGASIEIPAFESPCPITGPPPGAAPAGRVSTLFDASVETGPVVAPAPVASVGAAIRAPSRSSGPIGGSLPFTGLGTIQLLPLGVFCLFVGLLLLVGPRRSPRREALRYDGRFLA